MIVQSARGRQDRDAPTVAAVQGKYSLASTYVLTDAQFEEIASFVHRVCGIDLRSDKRALVRARLTKRMRELGLPGFTEYLGYLKRDRGGGELTAMLDAVSTNVTGFFRGQDHFDYLQEEVLPRLIRGRGGAGRSIRMWSAGCSSGEEPYSLAITLCEAIPQHRLWDIKILATDLSSQVLARAKMGVYPEERLSGVSPRARSRYFRPVDGSTEGQYRTAVDLRDMITFARLNLMGSWPMQGPFDAIFCRNVMIYFDQAVRTKLVQRFWELLAPGGPLFIGHSETLTGINHQFQHVQPAVYQKPADVQ